MNIFPTLQPGRWQKMNLDKEARKNNCDFTNPEECAQWIDWLHQQQKISYSYGGFLEERSTLWKDHYQKETGAFIHLGMDYNVPVGTSVSLPCKGIVEDIMIDHDQDGGWGGRIIWRIVDTPLYLIYGHLEHTINLKVGQLCQRGDIVGITAPSSQNGGWYPHLHVQIVDQEFMKQYPDKKTIDGYLTKDHRLLSHVYDPSLFVKRKR